MQPPARCRSRRPWIFFLGRPNKNGHDRPAQLYGGEQRRVIIEPKIAAEPNQRRRQLRRSAAHVLSKITPRDARSSSAEWSSANSSRRTSRVCSPSKGAGIDGCPGVSESFTGVPVT